MNCLLLNLAFADITVVAFFASRFILIRLYNHPDGKVGTILCKLLTGGTFGWIGSCASVFTLVAIAIERYYAVIRPLGNRATFTKDSLKVRFLASETTNHNLYLRTEAVSLWSKLGTNSANAIICWDELIMMGKE